eukprot:CAMPEP_0202978066 /NCGR_PEP_ID=MMETSP1396-20130829/84623_1 /ASSEMBLY_ACC=CAM_ASM_000872 /TAXON_ID= /ORGANISM="Pseudokeronopsis sp., Strain Brazil" /LENGTH=177 /DNA_ID=CAMNT_0049716931 /DNA_START=135 /DNA_END=668 /DNA_ORIENTATION=-
MQRRGLNFISDAVAKDLQEENVAVLEQEVDNVAPKIVGLLGLSASCDIGALKEQLAKHCISAKKGSKRENKMGDKDVMEDEGLEEEKGAHQGGEFEVFLCPNPGSSSNMTSKKQRLMFVEIDRDDTEHILEMGMVVDLVLVVMSCKETEVQGLKEDPDKYSHAIDETGYKALGLLRA